ncbi:hypothetical protein [Epilithonimonas lactis]|uniref:Uncharacterized protein n=1 Tax=Epilithonimonas lactis TaxID=421072 RepID=A0A085BM94_9FLAO|nr:hypothetical protein [Epilithonimonas lactis]KFC23589.1 hypothetical protein IO89_03140 [Epilithonimonas lactis]SEQ18570.1 hypothetical protein SAMN04488097_1594 [Epilithonimonas lactis]
MGITALFVILLVILIFLVSYIPNLTFRKKIFIVIAALLVCFAVLAFLFATQFGGGREPVQNETLEIKK